MNEAIKDALFIVLMTVLVFGIQRASAQTLYQSPNAAHSQCPSDTVVWLNTASGVYHFQGERWYGRTKHGAYVCEKQADDAGDRATENGQ